MARGRLRRALVRAVPSVAVALSVLVGSTRARAEGPATVRIVLDGCNAGAFDLDAFARVVEIELRGDGIERVLVVRAVAGADPAMATVTLAAQPCTADAGELEITLDDATTRKSVRRRVTFSDLGRPQRPRVLALAVAELLHASWSELRLADAPPPAIPLPESVRLALFEPRPAPPPPPPVVPAPPQVSLPRPAFVRADVAIEGRSYPNYGSAVLGPNVAASLGSGARWPVRLRLDARALFGTSYDPLGSLSTRLLGGGAAVVVARSSGPLDVELGPHLGAGWGWVAGNAAGANVRAQSGGGAVVDVSVLFALRVALGASFWATVVLDAGAVVDPLAGESADRRAAGFGGPMAGMAVGAGRAFF